MTNPSESSAAAAQTSNPDTQHLVIQTEHLHDGPRSWLSERCRLVSCSHEDPAFNSLLPSAMALVVRTYTEVNDELLDKAPNLRVVGRAGVSLLNIDIAACRRRGVEVVHTPGSNTTAVVEYVAAALLDVTRNRLFLDKPIDHDAWLELRKELTAKRELSELTLGIVGFGRIGQTVARLVGPLCANVIYHDIAQIPPDRRHGAVPVSREELCAQADAITVHVDDRPSNRRIFNTDFFGRLKSDSIFINASRGFVVDAAHCADFLRSHPAALAVLDVHDPEPIPSDYPPLGLPNAHLTPHIAGATRKASENMSWVVRDVWRVLNNQPPEFPAPEPKA